MENLKITLASGAELEATLASFQEGNRLFKAVSKELEGIDFESDTVHKIGFRLISSPEVEGALWPCMGRATYNKMKISQELFEDGDIRGDYLSVAKEVMVYNLLPFFKSLGLDSLLKILAQKDIDTQK